MGLHGMVGWLDDTWMVSRWFTWVLCGLMILQVQLVGLPKDSVQLGATYLQFHYGLWYLYLCFMGFMTISELGGPTMEDTWMILGCYK